MQNPRSRSQFYLYLLRNRRSSQGFTLAEQRCHSLFTPAVAFWLYAIMKEAFHYSVQVEVGLTLVTKSDSEPNLALNQGIMVARVLKSLCASHSTAEAWFSTHSLSIKISCYLRGATWTWSSGNCCNGWNSLVNLTILTRLVRKSSPSKKVSC